MGNWGCFRGGGDGDGMWGLIVVFKVLNGVLEGDLRF